MHIASSFLPFMECKVLCIVIIPSVIWCPLMNLSYSIEISLGRRGFNLLANILVMILYTVLQRLTSLYFFRLFMPRTFGMSVMNVAFQLLRMELLEWNSLTASTTSSPTIC